MGIEHLRADVSAVGFRVELERVPLEYELPRGDLTPFVRRLQFRPAVLAQDEDADGAGAHSGIGSEGVDEFLPIRSRPLVILLRRHRVIRTLFLGTRAVDDEGLAVMDKLTGYAVVQETVIVAAGSAPVRPGTVVPRAAPVLPVPAGVQREMRVRVVVPVPISGAHRIGSAMNSVATPMY